MRFWTAASLGTPQPAPVAALLVLTAVVTGARVGATVWHVPFDPGAATIEQALDSAAAGDTVQVVCGLYLELELVMKAGVVLRSERGEPAGVTVDAQSAGRVLSCADLDTKTVIEGVTLAGGRAEGAWPRDLGGAVACLAASPRIMR